MCERSQFNPDICRYCTRLYVSNKKIRGNKPFSSAIFRRDCCCKKIYLSSRTNVVGSGEDPFGVNLGGLYYESISSAFLI